MPGGRGWEVKEGYSEREGGEGGLEGEGVRRRRAEGKVDGLPGIDG